MRVATSAAVLRLDAPDWWSDLCVRVVARPEGLEDPYEVAITNVFCFRGEDNNLMKTEQV